MSTRITLEIILIFLLVVANGVFAIMDGRRVDKVLVTRLARNDDENR